MAEPGATESPLAEADRLIQEELARLISHDAVAYPPAGSKVAGGKQNAPALEDLSDEYLALARGEIEQELEGQGSKEKYEAFAAEFDQVWEQIQEEMKELQEIGLAAQFNVS
jgi:pre-mRNA-splicing factor CDC5/CEF1